MVRYSTVHYIKRDVSWLCIFCVSAGAYDIQTYELKITCVHKFIRSQNTCINRYICVRTCTIQIQCMSGYYTARICFTRVDFVPKATKLYVNTRIHYAHINVREARLARHHINIATGNIFGVWGRATGSRYTRTHRCHLKDVRISHAIYFSPFRANSNINFHVFYIYFLFFFFLECYAVCTRHAVHRLGPYYIAIVLIEEKYFVWKYILYNGITAGVNIKWQILTLFTINHFEWILCIWIFHWNSKKQILNTRILNFLL